MQLNKTKLALTMGALFLSAASTSYAASLTPNVKITTRDDVTLTEVTPMSFGANVFTAAGGVCTMDATKPTNAVAQANALATAPADFGLLSGDGCAAGNTATPGIYKIIGSAGAAVTVTVTALNATGGFTYAPNSGCVVNNTATATADACIALTASPITTRIADVAEGSSKIGESMILIGGTVTIGGAALTASTPYSDSFSVNVVY